MIYIADSSDITLTDNLITNAKWTNNPDEAESPTLADRLNAIHKALFTVPFDEDDAKVIIRGGTYNIPTAMYFHESRGGSDGKYFTVKAYKDEEVIIDGSLLTTDFSAMASFSSTSYVRLRGLTFANLKGKKSAIFIEEPVIK